MTLTYYGADLRDTAMGPARMGPVVETFPAPRFAEDSPPGPPVSTWAQSPGRGAPRASRWADRSGGWALPPGPVAPPASRMGTTWGQDAPAWRVPSLPDVQAAAQRQMDRTVEWWRGLTSQLHRAATTTAVGVVTGIKVPEESTTPSKAREYLAELLEQQGQLRGWPPAEVARYAAAIRATALAGTVGVTVDRILATAAPPPSWPGVDGWYTVAKQVQTSAALLSLGELAGKWQTVPADLLEAARQQGLDPRRFLDIAERVSKAAAVAVPAAAIATGLAAGGVLALLAVGLGGAYFAPEIATTARAGKTVARKGAARAKRAAEAIR